MEYIPQGAGIGVSHVWGQGRMDDVEGGLPSVGGHGHDWERGEGVESAPHPK